MFDNNKLEEIENNNNVWKEKTLKKTIQRF